MMKVVTVMLMLLVAVFAEMFSSSTRKVNNQQAKTTMLFPLFT